MIGHVSDNPSAQNIDLSMRMPNGVGFRKLGRTAAGTAIAYASRAPGFAEPLARLSLKLGQVKGPFKFESIVDPNYQYKASRRDRIAKFLFTHNPRGSSRLLRKVDEGRFDNVELIEILVARHYKAGNREAAAALRQRAVALEPNSAARRLALGLALGRAPQKGIVHDSVVGLTEEHVGRVEEALDQLGRASKLAPNSGFVAHAMAKALVRDGRVHEAIPCFERAVEIDPRADWLWDLGNAYGRPQVLRFEDSARVFHTALKRYPSNSRAYSSYINAVCRGSLDWQKLWTAATEFELSRRESDEKLKLFDDLAAMFLDDQAKPVASVVSKLEGATKQNVEISVTTVRLLALRLFFLGDLEQGFAVKQYIAEREIERLSSGRLTTQRLRALAQAMIYAGRSEDAVQLLDPPPVKAKSDRMTHRLAKLAADAHLVAGRVEPYLEYSRQAQARTPLRGDDKMRSLIKGKRVAIVGPAETQEELGEVIDSFDTVIRPRFSAEFVANHSKTGGSRTDITYYSGRDFAAYVSEAREVVQEAGLQFVVSRPLGFAAFKHLDEPWFRFYRHDFSLYFQGAALGISRIAYDIAQYAPQEICVFNSDFYTGASAFAPGYRATSETKMGAGSVLNDIFVAHDLRFEFEYTKALMKSGILTAQGVSAEVLKMDVESYIQRVAESGSLS